MNLKNLLQKYKAVYLDTTCYIYHLHNYGVYEKVTDELFFLIKNKIIFCSTIVIAELLAKPEIITDANLKRIIKESLYNLPNIEFISPDLRIAELAADLKVKYHLQLPDAIHLTSAVIHAEVFITNDKNLKRVKEIPVLILGDFI